MTARLIVDCETTGLDPNTAHIIEFAAVLLDGDKITHEYSSLVNCGAENIDPEAYAFTVNKIDPNEVVNAPEPEHVSWMFERFRELALALHGEYTIHAYNNHFDRSFLNREPWNLPRESWGECVMLESAKVMGQSRWPKLLASASHFGLVFDGNQHRALGDARMAAKVFVEIQRARGTLVHDASVVP